jgi:hypothetical protein
MDDSDAKNKIKLKKSFPDFILSDVCFHELGFGVGFEGILD